MSKKEELTMKYELTNETIKIYGRTLHRIKALRDVGLNVKKGDLGGFIENENNLSQNGNCWIFESAKVFDSAKVFGDAEVYDEAMVFGKAMVHNSAKIYDSVKVYNSAKVCGKTKIYDSAEIYGNATVYDNAIIGDSAQITKTTDVFTITPIGSRNDTTTFYKAQDNKIFVKCGCKNTDIDTWLDMVKETHGDNKHAKTYRLAAQIARLQILGEEV